ncbi:FeoA family protein [Sphingorhabdus sp.]|uniref:FeoA family protein n=1 Tax=Sphingorhabdus sp. TaxID=1902408 RepID=UPI003BB0E751
MQKTDVTLDQLPFDMPARISAINWDAIDATEGHRLRSLGFDSGIMIEVLHKGILLWHDPLAVRIGRMTVALRRKVAAAVSCELDY